MKDNLNIEELFQKGFENFQPTVDPSLWANIQAGIGTTAVVTTSVSVGVKIGLISTGIIAASVATWYFGFYEPDQNNAPNTNETVVTNTLPQEDANTRETIIYVNDNNDPVILENKEKIETELQNYQANNSTVVNNNSTTTVIGNDGSVTPINSNNSTTNQNINNSKVTNNINDNEVVDPITRPVAPSGRMEFAQSNIYAPAIITFTSNAQNQTEVRWDFGDGTTAEGVDAKHTYAKPGKYTVEMLVLGDGNAYSETQEIVVKSKSTIDNVPNVITPNGDRINDIFSVKTTDIETFTISIRDKNGNEIFSSNDKDFVWDGTNYSGETVEKGMFTYVIIAEGKDGSIIKLPGQIYVQ